MTSIPEDALADRKACQFHVYGAKSGALEWYPTVTQKEFPTLGVDAAKVVGDKQYDWKGKMIFQLTRPELPIFMAVLCHFRESCHFRGHGDAHDKGLEARTQKGGVFIRVYQADFGAVAVPVNEADAFYLLSLGMRQLVKAQPWLHGQNIPALLRAALGQANSR